MVVVFDPEAVAGITAALAEGLAEAVAAVVVGMVAVGASRIAVGKRALLLLLLPPAALAVAGATAAAAPGAATTGATEPPTRGTTAPGATGGAAAAAAAAPPPPAESPFTTGMQLFPQGLTNIRPPRAGSAHLDTVASLAAPAAVPGANPPAATNLSTSASQPHPDSTKRRMSAQHASSGGVWDIVSVTACSVAQSAVAEEAPTREVAACSDLQAPEASVAAACTQVSEAREGWRRRRRAARATTMRSVNDRASLIFFEERRGGSGACAFSERKARW